MFGPCVNGNKVGVAPHPAPPMSDSAPISLDESRPPAASASVARPPRLPSPADRDSVCARPESDPDLWVTVARELAE